MNSRSRNHSDIFAFHGSHFFDGCRQCFDLFGTLNTFNILLVQTWPITGVVFRLEDEGQDLKKLLKYELKNEQA